jgi:arylsulfatase A-like enzyme
LRLPQALPAGTRVAARTEEIDVFPTVTELAHIAPPLAASELDKVDGSSLLPLVRGEAQSLRPFAFAENAFFQSAQDERWKLIVDVEKVQGKEGKYETRLFDLKADPGEQRNLAAEQPVEVERMLNALRAWSSAMPHREMEKSARDLEQERNFRALGYTGEERKPR